MFIGKWFLHNFSFYFKYREDKQHCVTSNVCVNVVDVIYLLSPFFSNYNNKVIDYTPMGGSIFVNVLI